MARQKRFGQSIHRYKLVLAFAFLPQVAHCLYVGNPSAPMMPETGFFIPKDFWFGIKAGYELDYVFDRNIYTKKRFPVERKSVPKCETFANLGTVTFNFNDRIEVYSGFGAMSAHIHQRPFSNQYIHYAMQNSFTWDVGGKAILAYWGNTQVGADAKYLQYSPAVSSIHVNGVPYATDSAYLHAREWQVGMAVSHRFNFFIPYAGLFFSDYRAKLLKLDSLPFLFPSKKVTFKNDNPFGIFLGFGLAPEKGFDVNFEARFINELALSLSADIKF